MNPPLSGLWRWDGTIDRGPYALIGLLGFAIKNNLDRLVAVLVFHRSWSILSYWIPSGKIVSINALSSADARFFAALTAMALPFIGVGVVLTAKRLRSIGLPSWLVVLFFAPFVNLLFFLLLSLLPSRQQANRAEGPPPAPIPFLDRLIPDDPWGSAALAVVLTVMTGALAALLGTRLLATYGWGLFVALPFCLGLGSVLLYSYHGPRSYSSCVQVACFSVILAGLVLLLVAAEGLTCLLMALPIVLPLAGMGGSLGYAIQRRPLASGSPSLLLLVTLYGPGLMGVEHIARPRAPLFAVRTAIEVNAPPQEVWKRVVAFSEIAQPREWFFRTGIAYPIRAEISGHGAGAIRRCMFTTGPFVEPIEIWDEPRLLRFTVTSNPVPMAEWSPYTAIHPRHLDGFLVSRQGQFLLRPLPGGRTLLEGTTWYQHHLWPAEYWRLWSDAIIHRIHLRVLKHVKQLAESRHSG
jgi:uncharacterized membrane protein YhaH (DUF805 family)